MLAIAGGKGGVGKTTVTAGLARALAAQRRRPVAVDADADTPNLHHALDVPAGGGVGRLADGEDLDAVAADTDDGVRVVPALPGDDVAPALRRLAGLAVPVLVDSPGGAGPDAAVPLRAADRALVVTAPTPTAVEDSLATAAMARALDCSVEGVVVVGDRAPPTRVGRAFDAPVHGVPRVESPHGDSRVYDALAAVSRRMAERF